MSHFQVFCAEAQEAKQTHNTASTERKTKNRGFFFHFSHPLPVPSFSRTRSVLGLISDTRLFLGGTFFGQRGKKPNGPTGPMGSDSLLPFTACAGALTPPQPTNHNTRTAETGNRFPPPAPLYFLQVGHTHTHTSRTDGFLPKVFKHFAATQRHRHRHKCAWHFALLATFLLSSYLMSGQYPSPFLASAALGLLKAQLARDIFPFLLV